MPPQLTGVLYHVPPWAFQKQADLVHIIAQQDDTEVKVLFSNGQSLLRNMSTSQWFDFHMPQGGSARILSTRPVAAYYVKANGLSPDFSGWPANDNPHGDPEVIPLIPTSHFAKAYRTYAPPGYAQGQFIAVVAPNPNATISLDGAVVTNGFTPMAGGGKFKIIPVAPGEHVVSADKPIMAYAQGYHVDSFFSDLSGFIFYKKSSSYAYSGGFVSLATGELTAARIRVTPDAVNTGQSATVKADIINNSYVPLTQVRVRFTLGDPTDGGIPIGPDQIIPTLSAGQSQTLTATVSTPNGGVHNVFVSVDPLNVVAENIESDNTLSTPLRVISQGLVVATAETDHPSYFAQNPGKITTEMANIGAVDMTNLEVRASIETAGGTKVLDVGTTPVHLLEATPPAMADWHFRTKISFTAAKGFHTQVLFVMPVNFTHLFQSISVAGTFDSASPRVFEKSTVGLVERRCVFVPATGFSAINNAKGNVEWLAEGPIAQSEKRDFFLYFDIVANGPKADVPRPAEYIGNGGSFGPPSAPPVPVLEWLKFLKSNRDGTFGAPQGVGFGKIYDLATSLVATGIFLGVHVRDSRFLDLNSDGALDFMTNMHGTLPVIGSPRYSFQKTDQSFEASRQIWAGEAGNSPASNMEVADFDGDGKADIISFGNIQTLANFPTNWFWKGQGDGNFDVPVAKSSSDLGFSLVHFDSAVGDFNNDGKADIVLQVFSTTVYKNVGNVGEVKFESAGSQFVSGGGTIAVGDFDNDGNDDVIHGNQFTSQFTLIRGNGTGALLAPVTVPMNLPADFGSILNFVSYDFDRDQKQDLVIFTGATPGRVYLARGNGDGTFQPPAFLATAGVEFSNTWLVFAESGPLPRQVFLPSPTGASASPTVVLTFDFNTGDLLAGPYRARIDVVRASDGTLMATATDDFTILATQNGGAAALVTTDKTSYAPGDTASVSSLATSLGQNVTLTGLTATVTISGGPSAATVFTSAHPIDSLGPQQSIPLSDFFAVGFTPPGSYSAHLVVSMNGTTLAESSYPFVILEIFKLVGTLTVAPFAVDAGTPVTATFTISNQGNLSFSGTREIVVAEPSGGSILATYPAPLTNLAPGQSTPSATQSIATSLPPGGYMVILRAVSGTTIINLASAGFVVKSCPFLDFALFGKIGVLIQGTPRTDMFIPMTMVFTPLGNVMSNGNVTLSGTPNVNGNVSAAGTITLEGTPTITGTQTQGVAPITLPGVSGFIASAQSTNNNAAIGLTQNGKNPLQGGKLVIADGDSLTLAAGTYYFKGIDLSGTAKLKVGGTVKIAVAGDLKLSGQSVTNAPGAPPAPGMPPPTPDPSKLIIVMADQKKATIDGGAKLYGLLYGPGATVVLDGNSETFGAVVGKNVTLTGFAKVHYDPAVKAFCGFFGS